jgi:hypothetical protein
VRQLGERGQLPRPGQRLVAGGLFDGSEQRGLVQPRERHIEHTFDFSGIH